MIVKNHPVDPETYEKFSIDDSITVSKYGIKLVDAIGCLKCLFIAKGCFKSLKSTFLKKNRKFYLKPDSMKDVPDSESDSAANDTFKGLSPASIHLGEGAVLYLQMMKTFAILFFILTILNIPVFMMYSSMTEDNNYMSVSMIWQYFTLGNIGKGNLICGYSNIDYEDATSIYP